MEQAVRAAGHLAPHVGYQDRSGRWLLRMPGIRPDPRAITTICGIHRQRLHATLRQAAEAVGAELVTGAEVTAVRAGDPDGEGASFADELAAARAHFAGWAPWIRAVVAATAASQLMRHDVYHLPGGCPRYVRGRVVVTGDEAHAMLPTLGQGAASALEDGVCVGR